MTLRARVWKDLSLDDTISEYERSKLAVWDYPVTDKYTKILQTMEEANFPQSFEEALERVRHSPSQSSGFALIGEMTKVFWVEVTGDHFSGRYGCQVPGADHLRSANGR